MNKISGMESISSGDIHGCHEELILILKKLGYQKKSGRYLSASRRTQVRFSRRCHEQGAGVA
ncbi:hypothetical protein RCO48_23430 [Peribacillus frigoritolerans]|nr:hypothetical protein [Peribacillus frigoritolerans]